MQLFSRETDRSSGELQLHPCNKEFWKLQRKMIRRITSSDHFLFVVLILTSFFANLQNILQLEVAVSLPWWWVVAKMCFMFKLKGILFSHMWFKRLKRSLCCWKFEKWKNWFSLTCCSSGCVVTWCCDVIRHSSFLRREKRKENVACLIWIKNYISHNALLSFCSQRHVTASFTAH